MPDRQPSDRFLGKVERSRLTTLEASRQAHHRERWRRCGWWIVNAILVPTLLVPVTMFVIGMSVIRPHDMPSLFGMAFAIALSCLLGGIYGGGMALALLTALVGWKMRPYPLTDFRVWLWFMLVFCGYATILVCLYCRPGRGPWVPKRGLAFFRKPLGIRRQFEHHPLSHRRDKPSPRLAGAGFAPRLAALPLPVPLRRRLVPASRSWSAR